MQTAPNSNNNVAAVSTERERDKRSLYSKRINQNSRRR